MNSIPKILSQPQSEQSDARALTAALQASAVWLEAHFKIVNRQNVFPVPDGDTGTNMVLTMRAVVEAVTALSDPRVDEAATAAAQGALFGARGNSGVILSQFLQGFSTALAGQRTLTPAKLAEAVSQGAKVAEACVAQPVEGTLLTVLRATAEAAQRQARSGPGMTKLIARMVTAARQAQAKTPELLPVLKAAGVTDSGGLGFVYLLEGVWRWLCGQSLVPDETYEANFSTNGHSQTMPTSLGLDSEENYGYDVQFLLHGVEVEVSVVQAEIERLGWSVLVVGETDTLKVHLHTTDPAEAMTTAAAFGAVDDLVVEDMQHQAQAFASRTERDPAGRHSTIAVVTGAGFVRLFQSLGTSLVLSGRQGLPPDVTAFLAAIRQAPGDEVLILPNGDPALVAAREAQVQSPKRVAVVPSRSMPQGLAALLGSDRQGELERVLRRMAENAEAVRTLVVKPAGVDRPDQVVAILDGDPVAVGSNEGAVISQGLSRVNLEDFEIVTLYFGQNIAPDVAADVADELAECFPQLVVELHPGGQPDSYYIVALE